jgi:hypothetical protein
MEVMDPTPHWWCAISLRIAHPELKPKAVTQELGLSPAISFEPGQSKVHHGDCRSAGYWCGERRIDYPNRPSELILWMERLVVDHRTYLANIIDGGADVNVYLGIHLESASIGFDVPCTPEMDNLGIRFGIEIFGR